MHQKMMLYLRSALVRTNISYMTDMKQKSREAFVSGVKNAVCQLEKNASFSNWMKNNKRFREKFAANTIDLVKKVSGGTTK